MGDDSLMGGLEFLGCTLQGNQETTSARPLREV